MSTHTVDSRLVEILGAIVEEYESVEPGERQRLFHITTMGWEGFNGWGDDRPKVVRGDLDDLNDFGLIDLDFGGQGDYQVKPTTEGRNAIRTLRRENKLLEAGGAVDLDWATVRPVLHAVVDVWEANGASPSAHVFGKAIAEACDRENDYELIRICQALANADWIDLSFSEDDELCAKPTMRGVMATRDWPGADGEAAAEQLLSRIDKLIAKATPAKRKKLEGLRNAVLEVGTKTLAEVISKSVGTAV